MSHNLLTFVKAHLGEAKAGDAEAQVFLSMAMGFCERLATGDFDTAAYGSLADSWHCGELVAAENEVHDSAYWRDLAVDQGNGQALLERATDKQRTLDQRLTDVRSA